MYILKKVLVVFKDKVKDLVTRLRQYQKLLSKKRLLFIVISLLLGLFFFGKILIFALPFLYKTLARIEIFHGIFQMFKSFFRMLGLTKKVDISDRSKK